VNVPVRVLMEAALEVARLASLVALRYYKQGLPVEAKRDGSPVTLADRAAEQLAREWIHARFPADGVLGEEFGETPGASGRRWLLDPIDGTKSFVRGVPLWGTCVAVCEGDDVLAGAAAYPAVDEHLAAAPGEGCWHNGARCQVSAIGAIEAATVLITDARTLQPDTRREGWQRLSSRALVSRGWGDCYGYLLVATGRAEVMVDPILNPWDAPPFLPIIEEAGGVFTDWSGRRDVFAGNAVATNRALADAARALLWSADVSR
jgi:histidinol phosphatase-like enzyme (inositol monophosphatase family)